MKNLLIILFFLSSLAAMSQVSVYTAPKPSTTVPTNLRVPVSEKVGNVVYQRSLRIDSFPSSGGTGSSVVIDATQSPYNVVGDGTTDNTNAINAAIQAATSSKGVVWLGTGIIGVRVSYRDTATVYQPKGIIMAEGVTLMGAGIGKTTIIALPPPAGATYSVSNTANTAPATNTKFFDIVNVFKVNNTTIRDLSINGKLSTQINYNFLYDAYHNPADSNLQTQTSAIVITSSNNNKVLNVNIDSVPSYGINNWNSTNSYFQNIRQSMAINAGVYFTKNSDGSTLRNSIITNNYADNVRIKSNNINISENEISWAKFNTNPINGAVNYAGIYVEGNYANDTRAPIGMVGIKVTNNHIHDNSSYGIDVTNATDTIVTTGKGTTLFIANNKISYNGNGGITISIPNTQIENNSIENNGALSTGVKDGLDYKNVGINLYHTPPGYTASGAVIIGNTFKSTSGNSTQLYGINGINTTPFLNIAGNVQRGGVSVVNSSLSYNGINNSTYDSTGALKSDFTTVSGTGTIVTPYGNGLIVGDAINSSYNQIRYGTGTSVGAIIGSQGTTPQTGVYFDNQATLGGTSGAASGREIRFFDQVSNRTNGGFNASGDFVVGTSTAVGGIIRVPGSDLSTNINQAEFYGTSTGTSTTTQQAALYTELKPGFTGAGYSYSIYAVNNALGTGNTISSWATLKGNMGIRSVAQGATSSGANMGGFFGAWSGLRAVGVIGDAASFQANNASALSVGVIGFAKRANASAIHIGGYFGLQNTQPTFTSAALMADNGAETSPIFVCRDNGTNVFVIPDGGASDYADNAAAVAAGLAVGTVYRTGDILKIVH